MNSMETTELDTCLDLLARYYRARHPSADALPRLLARLQQEQRRELADNELDWLAAAGTPFPPVEPDDKP